MKKSFTITLASPCSEKWESFTPTSNGAFCQSCSKEVIDFTRLSDQQLIDYFKNKPANTCGKFRPEQLTTYSFGTPDINPGWRFWKAGLMALSLATVSKPTTAQPNVPLAYSITTDDSPVVVNQEEKKLRIVTGTVLSAEDGLALPAVRVLLVGTKTETYTDADGKFRFPEELEDKDELLFIFIGLKSQTLRVSGADEMIVRMEAELMPLGGIVVGGARATKRISFRRWWWNLKNLF